MPLEDDVALGAHHVGAELLPVIAIRARRIFPRIALRGALIVGDEDGARDAPVVRIGAGARAAFTLLIVRPVARQPVRQEEVRRKRMEIALAHRDHAFRMRRHHRADDLGPWPLIRLVYLAAPHFGYLRAP